MRFSLALIVCALAFEATTAAAQQPAPAKMAKPKKAAAAPAAEIDHDISLGQMTPTPEMWFYDQSMRQYRDPKMAVRRRAEFEADQRQMRLASQRWFGFSNSRPMVNPTPFTGVYSPMWTANSVAPYQWSGAAPTTVIVPAIPARAPAGYGLW